MGIFDKAKNLAGANPDKVNKVIDKAGDMVDEKTGGKYAGQVDQGQDLARGHLGTTPTEAPTPPAPGAPQAEAPPVPEGEQPPPPPAPEGEQPPA